MGELIAKLEAATEGSRELDAAIRFAVVGDMTRCNFDENCHHGKCTSPGCGEWLGIIDERRSYPNRWQDDERLPNYTTSVDAALLLQPEGFTWGIRCGRYVQYIAEFFGPQWSTCGEVDSNPALALCIAALKARTPAQQKEPDDAGK